MALRHHPAVVSALEDWWATALNSLRSGHPNPPPVSRLVGGEGGRDNSEAVHESTGGGEDADLGDVDVAYALQKEHYLDIWSRIYRVLVGGSPYKAAVAAEAEWDVDRKGAPALTRELWLDAIFDLADTWTRGVEVRAPCARERRERG